MWQQAIFIRQPFGRAQDKPFDKLYLKLRAGVSGYKGSVGDLIRVRVTDDFKVVQVKVTITNADGSPVEQGDAVKQG